ncbi:MAG: tRNA pseudouridine(55) synthase TruB [Acidobacteria bacterium]|nr:tRNA pseudouridine(55) synthase TruB [Acidobacteriota bacterium]
MTERTSASSYPKDGVVVIDKPEGPSSHDVVAAVRRCFATRVGHAGTLDPLASGVLPLLLGRATRLARFFLMKDKEYLATIQLGQATSTFDREGDVTEEKPVPQFTENSIKELLRLFTGKIDQRIPLFSAVKLQGQKLYRSARGGLKGRDLELPHRMVHIYNIEMISRTEATWILRICCSAGTYVRALAHDMGQSAGTAAHLGALRRLRSGDFRVEDAVQPVQLAQAWQAAFRPLEELLPEFPRIDLQPDEAKRIVHGNKILKEVSPGWSRLFFENQLIALAEGLEGALQPMIVLALPAPFASPDRFPQS